MTFLSRYILLIFSIVATLTVLATFGYAGTLASLDDALKASVYITDGTYKCSGFVVSIERRLVATAAHCVEGAHNSDRIGGKYAKMTVEGHAAYIDGYEPMLDLALLVVPDPKWKPEIEVRLGGQPYTGQAVYLVGNPLFYADVVGFGIVARVSGLERWGDENNAHSLADAITLNSSGSCRGSSGGMVLATNGTAIGMVVAGGPGECGPWVVVVPIKYVKQLVEKQHAAR